MYKSKPKLGRYKVRCDQSGFVVASDDVVTQWNGLKVYKDFAEPRHPQELIQNVKDGAAPPWTRPYGSKNDTVGIGAMRIGSTFVISSAPAISPDSCAFSGSIAVTIESDVFGNTVYYTLDGTDPSRSNGFIYNGPLTISATTTVKAVSFGGTTLPSGIAEQSYTAT